ncbi:hypothetical protein [Alicyclobacillus sp.]|uniref:hypothetical protein n=1 Tax=Alicyclobacillus sp. TaxID=61169 RepID=UPI0025C5C824|nr:hypothetical protein [Alicyclobacillus sp.]MCL6516308.1 hypothetical protein [Alicyclobacillus sp.]
MPTGEAQVRARVRRNRIWFVAGAALVLVLAGLFAHLTLRALTVRATTSSEFSQYVVDHGIGRVELMHDASGFDEDFMVLHLSHPVAEDQLQAQATAWMKLYYQLDGGTTLTMDYVDAATGKRVVQADAVYDPQKQTLSLTLNEGGERRLVRIPAAWQRGGN